MPQRSASNWITAMIPEKVQQILDAHQLQALEFAPGSTPTSVLAAQQIGVEVGQIAKSMLLKAKSGQYYLAVCPGDRRICSKKVRQATGSKTRMARADETEAVTGFRPGGVCPFGVEGVEILIDQGLAAYAIIYPAAGNDASGVPLSFDKLKLITGARVVDVMLES
jgi:prolyl-tRNA editing enzyme YbaK/EbsC (Cys-tRNA(Pro) deacylase)